MTRLSRSAVAAVAALALAAGCGSNPGGGNNGSGNGEFDAASYFSGRTIDFIISVSPGSSSDLEGRLIADHIGRLIPGQPDINVRNLEGSGGLAATEYIFQAEPDGLTLAYLGAGDPAAQLLGPYQSPPVEYGFDLNEMSWIGGSGNRAIVGWANNEAGFSTMEELMAMPQGSVRAGATRVGSGTFNYSALIREFGAPIEVVPGYDGAAAIHLAMYQNEVQMMAGGWATLLAGQAGVESGNSLVPFVVLGDHPPAQEDLEEHFGITEPLPHIKDLTDDLAYHELVDLVMLQQEWGRLLAAPPGLSDELTGTLRSAFLALDDDPEFIEDRAQRQLEDVMPTDGAVVTELISRFLQTPQESVERYVEMVEGN